MRKFGKLVLVLTLVTFVVLTFVACGEEQSAPNVVTQDMEIYRIYKLYLANGGKLSYDEWLATIKGEKGDKGDQGLQGDKGEKGDKGDKGADGITPTIEINSDGYWVINGTVTNVKAEGQQGVQGEQGIQGEKGDTGAKGDKGDTGSKGDTGAKGDKGDNGLTPYVGDNGNWWIGEEDTGITAYNDLLCRGKIGNNMSWSLTKYGKLTISGVGVVPTTKPWSAFESILTEVVFEEGITAIPDNAFENCRYIQKISLPSTIQSVGDMAFVSAEELFTVIDVYYSGTVESWVAVEKEYPWTAYNLYLNGELLTDLVLPDSFDLPEGAFESCFSLRNVVLPSTMTVVPRFAFSDCINLRNVVLPEGIRTIGGGAFSCSGLITVTLPSTLESIEYSPSAFNDCSVVEVYNLSPLVITAGNWGHGYVAYYAKAVYTEPYESKISIDEEGYIIYTDGEDVLLLGYTGEETDLLLPEGITEIYYGAFKYNQSLRSVVIPDSVRSICEGAFEECGNLSEITIGNNVTVIDRYAFGGCVSLASIGIPDSVTSIGYYAFADCTSLTSITIPDSVTSIGEYAFSNCTSLQYNEYDNAYYLGNETNPYVVLIKAKDKSVVSCSVHENTKIVYDSAFSGPSLTSITLGNGVTSIGDRAFNNCTSLTNITIPGSVTSIGHSAFEDCTSLTSITIPDSVTSIGWNAFRNCTSLTSITFEGTKAQWNAISKDSYWNDNTGNFIIHCTDGDIEK